VDRFRTAVGARRRLVLAVRRPFTELALRVFAAPVLPPVLDGRAISTPRSRRAPYRANPSFWNGPEDRTLAARWLRTRKTSVSNRYRPMTHSIPAHRGPRPQLRTARLKGAAAATVTARGCIHRRPLCPRSRPDSASHRTVAGQKRTHALQQYIDAAGLIPFGFERGFRGYRKCREGSRGSDAGPCPRHVLTGGLVQLH